MEKLKINDTHHEILNISSNNNNLLQIEFLKETTEDKVKSFTIELYTEGGSKCATFTGYNTIYKTIGKVITLSNDGSVYKEPEPIIPSIPTDPTIPIEPYIPTEEEIKNQLENSKTNKIIQTNHMLEEYLFKHPILYTDGLYYSVTKDKQVLLTSRLLSYQLELQSGIQNPELTWNSSGEVCVEWEYNNLVDLALKIKNYVEPLIKKQQSYEKQITMCATLEELSLVVINYETVD